MNLSAPGKRDAISRFLTGNSGSEGLDRGNPCIAGTGRKCHICPMARTKENLKAAPAKITSEHLGVSADTLRRWAARGLINATITAGGHYRYNLQEYLEAVEEAVRRAK